jgi:hypothetical protein
MALLCLKRQPSYKITFLPLPKKLFPWSFLMIDDFLKAKP